MPTRPLRLGQWAPDDLRIRRSGVRWLKQDGESCRAHEIIGFCNIGRFDTPERSPVGDPFAREGEGLQVALAAPFAGRLRHDSSRGGVLDLIDNTQVWSPDLVIGAIETGGESGPAEPADAEPLLLAGRSCTELLEQRYGVLAGWNDRTRAWWGDGGNDVGTILGMGFCQMSSMVRGGRQPYGDLFNSVCGPTHVVYVSNPPLHPSVALLLDQIRRTPADVDDLRDDMLHGLLRGTTPPLPADLIFASSLLTGLTSCLLTDTYPLLTRSGFRRTGPPDAVLMSIFADSPWTFRHKTLGYRMEWRAWQGATAGPAIREWLERSFERVPRDLDDIRADYVALIDEARSRAPPGHSTKFLIMNGFSTAGDEDLQSYAGFDSPMGDTLESIRDKDANLILCDLARDRDVAVLDFDAIAAEMGAQQHLPDGDHPSGALVTEARAEIVRILREQKVPGFANARA